MAGDVMSGADIVPDAPPNLTTESARLLFGIVRAAYDLESAGGLAVSPSRPESPPVLARPAASLAGVSAVAT